MQIFERVSKTRFEGATGTVERISGCIIEIRLARDIEMGGEEAEAIQRCIRTLADGTPAALLIDRRTSHTLSFEAQQVVAADDRLLAVAYLAVSAASQVVVGYSKSTYFKHVPVRSFTERERALAWLKEAVQAASARPKADAPESFEQG